MKLSLSYTMKGARKEDITLCMSTGKADGFGAMTER